jgi:hypothetical protein
MQRMVEVPDSWLGALAREGTPHKPVASSRCAAGPCVYARPGGLGTYGARRLNSESPGRDNRTAWLLAQPRARQQHTSTRDSSLVRRQAAASRAERIHRSLDNEPPLNPSSRIPTATPWPRPPPASNMASTPRASRTSSIDNVAEPASEHPPAADVDISLQQRAQRSDLVIWLPVLRGRTALRDSRPVTRFACNGVEIRRYSPRRRGTSSAAAQ